MRRPDWYVLTNCLGIAVSAVHVEIAERVRGLVRGVRAVELASIDRLRAPWILLEGPRIDVQAELVDALLAWWRDREAAIARALGVPLV
jgi:hypothetical protein